MSVTVRQNPDAEYANKVYKKIQENDGYCPCRIDKTPDTKCMCKDFREQIKRGEKGYCHCKLWYTE